MADAEQHGQLRWELAPTLLGHAQISDHRFHGSARHCGLQGFHRDLVGEFGVRIDLTYHESQGTVPFEGCGEPGFRTSKDATNLDREASLLLCCSLK